MATKRSQSYFISKFITNYVVTAADMQDFAASCLFYIDNMGWTSSGFCIRPPETGVLTSPDYNTKFIVILPDQSQYNPATFDADTNLIESFIIPSTWSACTSITISDNLIPTFACPASLVNLTSLNLSKNKLTVFTIDSACTTIQSLDVSTNLLTNFTLSAAFVNLTAMNAKDNSLTAAAMANILIPIANSGAACVVAVSGGTNAAIGTWNAPTIAAKATIIANGGSVANN